jgi:hypothetical protein
VIPHEEWEVVGVQERENDIPHELVGVQERERGSLHEVVGVREREHDSRPLQWEVVREVRRFGVQVDEGRWVVCWETSAWTYLCPVGSWRGLGACLGGGD